MSTQDRNEMGKFAAKGESIRAVRTMRMTDSTWRLLGDKADELDISKADYLEGLFSGQIEWESDDLESDESDLSFDVDEVVEKLTDLATSKERGNKYYKNGIAEVLELMGHGLEEE